MRKIYLLIFTLVSFSAAAQTTLDSFFSVGAQWCETETVNIGLGQTGNILYTFSIKGDTVVNGKNYHTLNGKCAYMDKTLGVLRTDSDKVYFIMTDTFPNTNMAYIIHDKFINKLPRDTEFVLYDFNLYKGKTVPGKSYAPMVNDTDIVSLTPARPVTKYYFIGKGNPSEDYWIDNIGSSLGFFGKFFTTGYSVPPTGFGYIKTCSYTNGIYSYVFKGYDTTEPCKCKAAKPDTTSNTAVHILNTSPPIHIYPNPLNDDQLHFKCTTTILSLSIRGMTGKLVYSNNAKQQKGEHTVELSLEPGIYFINIITEDGRTQTQKIVKL